MCKSHYYFKFPLLVYSCHNMITASLFYFQEEDIKDGTCFVFNPVLPCPLFLSLSVDDTDVVDCVIETMRQLSSKVDNLVKFLQ